MQLGKKTAVFLVIFSLCFLSVQCSKTFNWLNAQKYFKSGNTWADKGDYDKAITEFDKVIELDSKFTLAYSNRGNVWSEKCEYDKSIADYDKALELDPKSSQANNNKAWLLATCPNEKYRNGTKAIELARKAVEVQSGFIYLDTLAAAFAEIGKFKEAIAAQEKAIALLKEKGSDEQTMAGYRKRLENYKAGKPWRE
jgi:tetratricopeptide (TPR) repeat protein